MSPQTFLDTAAMYALFRVADDIVDSTHGTAESKAFELERFMSNFWTCLKKGKGQFEMHPILPAVIETCVRLKYRRELFERFFKSMVADTNNEGNICEGLSDTLEYIDGSAAVIGEFMAHILLASEENKEIERLLPRARHLGQAFQLTNMIRDIGEDLDMNRQYVPLEICREHNVNLRDRDVSSPGFPDLMEHMFDIADDMYVGEVETM